MNRIYFALIRTAGLQSELVSNHLAALASRRRAVKMYSV
jgi:hypothetical protein